MPRHPARLAASLYVGRRPILLTFCTFGRRRVFTDRATVSAVLAQLLRSGRTEAFEIVAYCFMPDHVHTVMAGTSARSDFPRFVRLAKQRTDYHFRRTSGFRLWQPSFFDQTVRDGHELREAIRYVLMNPVQAGMVATPAEYRILGVGNLFAGGVAGVRGTGSLTVGPRT